jgi:heptosyltransferase-2
LPGRHHTDEYFRVLTGGDYSNVPQHLGPIPAEDLPPSPLPMQPGKPRVVLVAAGARNLVREDALRRWPLENYVELARLLLARGCDVVLCGAPSDAWASPAFADTGVTDLTGRLSLLESLALLDSAALTITHDTGPLHLAGITRCAVLSLFGPTDPHGRQPQRANCVAIWGGEEFACRPCYDGRDYAPCTHNGCIREITPALAFAQADALLRAAQAGEALPPRIVTPGQAAAGSWIRIAPAALEGEAP